MLNTFHFLHDPNASQRQGKGHIIGEISSKKGLKTQTIRTGKKRIINLVKQLFDVAVVKLKEVTVELPLRDGTRIMG